MKSIYNPFRSTTTRSATIVFACFTVLHTSAHAATVDTTSTTVTYTAPQNILDTTWIGNGTLNFDGSGLIGLDNSGGGHPDFFNMTGGSITVQNGVTLQNGGWQGGVWTNNLASLDLASGATLDVWDGTPVRVDALTGAGTVTISPTPFVNWAGSRSLVLGVNGGGGTFTGNIAGNGAVDGGSLSLTKEGAGTQTLSGNNTFSGNVLVSGGTLQGTAGNAFGSLDNTRTITVSSGATLDFNANGIFGGHATTAVPTLILNGGTATNTGVNGNNPLNNITLNGGTLTATTSNGPFQSWNINGTVTSTGTSTINAGITLASGALTNTNFDVQSGTLNISNIIADGRDAGGPFNAHATSLTKLGAGTLSLTGTNTYTGNTNVNQGTLEVTNIGAYVSGTTTIAANSTFAANLSGNQTVSGNIIFTGSGTLLKNGPGTWVVGAPGVSVSFNMSAGGLVDIEGGTIQNNYVHSSWGANLASVKIASGATLDLFSENGQMDALSGGGTLQNGFAPNGLKTVTIGVSNGSDTFAGVISGAGGNLAVVKTGTGTQTLTGANTYGGGTTINAGTLQIGNGGSTGSYGTGPVTNNATLVWNNTSGLTVSSGNAITGSGAFTIKAGVVNVRYDAGGSVSSGTITVDGSGSSNNSSLIIWAPNAVTLANNFVLNSMGPAQNRGAINQDGGPGLVTLNGSITLAGDSRIGVGGGSWNSMVINGQVTGGGKLYVYESPSANPSTQLTLNNGANNYSGGTEIEQGRLTITNAAALGTGAVTITGTQSQLLLDGVGGTIANNFTLGGGGNPGSTNYGYGNATMLFHNDGQTATFSGTITLSSDAKLRGYSGGGTTNFSNPIVGTGNLTFEAGGAAPGHTQYWGLGGSVSTFTGNVLVRGDGSANSYLRLNGGALPSGTVLTLEDQSFLGGNNAVFDLNGNSQTLAGLSRVAGAGGLGSFVTNSGGSQSTLTINGSADSSFSGVIGVNTAGVALGQSAGGDNIALVKSGSGTFTLSGANTYTGATNVTGGKLVVNGSISTSILTTISSGATLAGTGTVGAALIQGGATLSPGDSGVGTLTLGGATPTLGLNNTSILNFDFDPTNQAVGSGINDLVTGISAFTLDGILNVMATNSNFLGATTGDTWRLFDYSGVLSDNTLALGSLPGLGAGLSWSVDTSIANQVNLTVIPEPNVAALLGGFGMLALLRRRRH